MEIEKTYTLQVADECSNTPVEDPVYEQMMRVDGGMLEECGVTGDLLSVLV